MASISSSFHCLSSSSSSVYSTPGSTSTVTRVRCQRPRPVSAVCATSPGSTLYDVLGIQSEANCQEIKSAYRSLARVLHPDVVNASNTQNDVASADGFISLHAAYSTLSDPGKRADYDRALFIRRRLGQDPQIQFVGRARGSSASRVSRRSWETDQCW